MLCRRTKIMSCGLLCIHPEETRSNSGSKNDAIGVFKLLYAPHLLFSHHFRYLCALFVFSCLCSSCAKVRREARFLSSPFAPINRQMKIRSLGDALLKRWYRMLGLSQQSPSSWYRDRLWEELRERRSAKTSWQMFSETSDVVFSSSRAEYDGFPVRRLPPFVTPRHILVYAYMLAKFTLRWKFYRTVAILCNAPQYDLVREVKNLSKDHKLKEVALRYHINPVDLKELFVNCDEYGLFSRRDVVPAIVRFNWINVAERIQSMTLHSRANPFVLCNICSVLLYILSFSISVH